MSTKMWWVAALCLTLLDPPSSLAFGGLGVFDPPAPLYDAKEDYAITLLNATNFQVCGSHC